MTKQEAYTLFQTHYDTYCQYNLYGDSPHAIKIAEVVKDLNKNAQVKRAYISTRGNLIVLTKPLYPIDPADNHRYPQIGRFTIRIRYRKDSTTEDDISIANRDYQSYASEYSSYCYHPHILYKQDVCFGENQDMVERAYDNGDIYGLIDFILLFLTTWNQDDGNPYLGYEAFYTYRTRAKSTTYIEKEAV